MMALSLKLSMALFLVVAAYQAHGKPVTRTDQETTSDDSDEMCVFEVDASGSDSGSASDSDDEAVENVVQTNDGKRNLFTDDLWPSWWKGGMRRKNANAFN